MTSLVARLSVILLLTLLSLLMIFPRFGSAGQTVVAFVYVEPGVRYFALLDTQRNITHRINQPVDALRGVYFSPDGQRVLIPHGDTSQLVRLAIFDLPSQTLLRNRGEYNTCSPSYDALLWSPDSRRVLFDCNPTAADPGSSGLHVMDFETERTHRIAGAQFSGLSIWSPNGDSLLIDGTEVLNLNSGERRELPSDAWLARWLPDSSRLILVIEDDILFDDGTIISEDLSVAPAFFEVSPDGRHLAFVAQEKGLFRLTVVDLSTFERVPIDGGDLKIDDVQRGAWSPDGAWIAVEARNDGGTNDLFLVTPDGTQAHLIAEDGILPVWSDDSSQLAFLALNRGTITGDQLVVVEVATETVQLSVNDGEQGIWSAGGVLHVRRMFGDPSAAPNQLYLDQRLLLDTNIISFAVWEHNHD